MYRKHNYLSSVTQYYKQIESEAERCGETLFMMFMYVLFCVVHVKRKKREN